MRRKDREITDITKIQQIINNCHCCRLGFNDNGEVYILPMNFGFIPEENIFYFHCAKEGRKIDIIKKNPNVGFEMDTNYKLNEGDIACEYSARFQSIIGNGIIEFVDDKEGKIKGLSAIMKQATGKADWTYSDEMLTEVCIFKMIVKEMSCKEHL